MIHINRAESAVAVMNGQAEALRDNDARVRAVGGWGGVAMATHKTMFCECFVRMKRVARGGPMFDSAHGLSRG